MFAQSQLFVTPLRQSDYKIVQKKDNKNKVFKRIIYIKFITSVIMP